MMFLSTIIEIKTVVVALAEEVSTRLRRQQFNANSLSVTLKTAERPIELMKKVLLAMRYDGE